MSFITVDAARMGDTLFLHLYLRHTRGRPKGGAPTNRDECTCEPQARVHEERFL